MYEDDLPRPKPALKRDTEVKNLKMEDCKLFKNLKKFQKSEFCSSTATISIFENRGKLGKGSERSTSTHHAIFVSDFVDKVNKTK
jgi:hypothetical protein